MRGNGFTIILHIVMLSPLAQSSHIFVDAARERARLRARHQEEYVT